MTPVLLVLVAELSDLASFGLAVGRWGIAGEQNPAFAALWAAGPGAFVALKVAGAIALALLALHVPRRWALLPALVGIAGAATNLLALT